MATRWPETETVDDLSQGARLATMQALARYWAKEYDWRKCEARLDALPHFLTEIDGLDIHFIHVRSEHEDALPLIVTHGWPGSVIEQLKIIDPLTNPTAHGGERSGRVPPGDPVAPGLRILRQAGHDRLGPRAHRKRLDGADEAPGIRPLRGDGGDWGAASSTLVGAQAPPELAGIHTNMAGVVPPDVQRRPSQALPRPTGSQRRGNPRLRAS